MDERFDQTPEELSTDEPSAARPGGKEEPSQAAADDLFSRIRGVTFPTARRGYDRRQVDRFLESLAERFGSMRASLTDDNPLRRELERVGDSTKGILTAAEQTARELLAESTKETDELRRSARETADKIRREAQEFADSTREAAEDQARRVTLEASRSAEETIAAAEARAEEVTEESLRNRRGLEARIERLRERRDAIVDQIGALADELRGLATPLRGDDLAVEDLDEEGAFEEDEADLEDVGEGDAEFGEPEDDEGTQEFAGLRDLREAQAPRFDPRERRT